MVRTCFSGEAPQSLESPAHSLLPFPEFSLMDKDSLLRETGGEETKGSKRSPRFKEDRRCVTGVEGKFPSLSAHITFPFFSSLLLACTVSHPYASLMKGKGVIRFLKMERKVFYAGKGFENVVEEGRMTKGGEVRNVEADRTEEGKEEGGCGKEKSKIDVKYVGIKAC